MNVIMFPTMFFLLIGIVFFIILLIKLLSKNPKFAAILLIVPVVLIAVFVLMRFFNAGVPRRIPQISIPQFSLVFMLLAGLIVGFIILMINLLKNNPKNAAILLIFPIVLIAVFVLMFFIGMPVERRVSETQYPAVPQIVNTEYPSSDYSPIWSEGIENEFKADIYPSKIAAIRSIALRLREEAQNLLVDLQQSEPIHIYRMGSDSEFAEILQDAILKRYPEKQCSIYTKTGTERIPNSKKIIISLNPINKTTTESYQIGINREITVFSGRKINDSTPSPKSGVIGANIIYGDRSIKIGTYYDEKPWVENFSSFTNSQPNRNYIVAKSNETCMTHEEADRQAMQNANNEVGTRLLSYLNPNKLEYKDILKSGIVADKFVQSFDGSAGKIWRQAILLDVSHAKLTRLANMISNAGRERSMNWARTILSIAGLFVLITIVYAFLNAATRGYYSLTLKIVGVILAVIFLFIILTIS